MGFILLLHFKGWAQPEDSSREIKTAYASLSLHEIYPDSFVQIDTNLDLVHQYNEAFKFDAFGYNTGNIGSPYLSLKFDPVSITSFDPGLHQFDYLKYRPEDILFFDTYTPFFDFSYVQGKQEMQLFRAVHARNINPFWNVSIQYNSINSQGLYYQSSNNHQQTKVKNIGITSRYRSPNQRYKLYASYIANRFFIRENGGVVDDSTFWATSDLRRSGADFSLYDAKQTLLEDRMDLTHSFRLNGAKSDTLLSDSLMKKRPKFKLDLVHHTSFVKTRYEYYDPYLDSSYYSYYYINSDTTDDTLYYWEFSNELFLKLSGGGKQDFLLKSGFRFSNGLIGDINSEKAYTNVHFITDVNKQFSEFGLKAKSDFVLSGINQGNYHINGQLEKMSQSGSSLFLGVSSGKYAQAYTNMRLYSNHLNWDYTFDDMAIEKLYFGSRFNVLKTSFLFSVSKISNYLYFNEQIEPLLFDRDILYFSVSLTNHIQFWRIHVRNNLCYQKHNASQAISIPALMFNNTTYYEDQIFKDKLHFQLGFDLRMKDAFYSQAYYAPYSIFYNQNEIMNEFYPIMDAFLNVVVKKMKIFLKYEHLNDGWLKESYYSFPYYPMDPGVFRLGLSWMFFD